MRSCGPVTGRPQGTGAGVYISPEEQDCLEMEASARKMEESCIAEPKERWSRKGLDFDAENQKVPDARAALLD